MKVRPSFVAVLLVSLGAVITPASAGEPVPTTWSYPGSAPCNASLQACVDAAAPGDTIEIVADVATPGNVQITKSITIEGSPGLATEPRIGNAASQTLISVASQDATDLIDVDVTLGNLRTERVRVNAMYAKGSGSTLVVEGLSMEGSVGGTGGGPLEVTSYVPMSVILADNRIESDGYPIRIRALPGADPGIGSPIAGTFEAWVERNVITTADPDTNAGVDLSLRPGPSSVARVKAYDNLLVGLAGCDCGGASALSVQSLLPAPGTGGRAIADLWHNTVVRTARGGLGPAAAIGIDQSVGSSLRVNMFDNIMADGRGWGIRAGGFDALPKVVSGFNDSYGNSKRDEWNGIAHPRHLSVDPRFVDPSAEDFRLRASSPLVDAGAVCRPGALGIFDVAGRQRLAGPTVDIGAYERGGVVGAPGVVGISGSGASFMLGTEAQDFLCGFGGSDELEGYGGNDYLDGGKGDDFLFGGPGPDVLVTKDGSAGDQADGGRGVDLCRTDPGDVRVSC